MSENDELLIELDEWREYDTGQLPGRAAARIRDLETALAQERAAKEAAEAVIARVRRWNDDPHSGRIRFPSLTSILDGNETP